MRHQSPTPSHTALFAGCPVFAGIAGSSCVAGGGSFCCVASGESSRCVAGGGSSRCHACGGGSWAGEAFAGSAGTRNCFPHLGQVPFFPQDHLDMSSAARTTDNRIGSCFRFAAPPRGRLPPGSLCLAFGWPGFLPRRHAWPFALGPLPFGLPRRFFGPGSVAFLGRPGLRFRTASRSARAIKCVTRGDTPTVFALRRPALIRATTLRTVTPNSAAASVVVR
jgi:hypothetical protein